MIDLWWEEGRFISNLLFLIKTQKINGSQDQEVVDCINRCENASEGATRLVDQVKLLLLWIASAVLRQVFLTFHVKPGKTKVSVQRKYDW